MCKIEKTIREEPTGNGKNGTPPTRSASQGQDGKMRNGCRALLQIGVSRHIYVHDTVGEGTIRTMGGGKDGRKSSLLRTWVEPSDGVQKEATIAVPLRRRKNGVIERLGAMAKGGKEAQQKEEGKWRDKEKRGGNLVREFRIPPALWGST